MNRSAHYDVVVVGGGMGGVAAAITASRAGARVLLVERFSVLGGMGTAGMVGALCGLYASGPGRLPVPGTVSWEIVERLDRRSACKRVSARDMTYVVHYDVGELIRILDELVTESRVDVMLHSELVAVETEDSGQITSATILQRDDRLRVSAGQFIDASGDATLAHLASGATMENSVNERQESTLMFRMANVEIDTMREVGRDRAREVLGDCIANGEYDLPRPHISFWSTTRPREVNCNMTAIRGYDLLSENGITLAEMEGRRQAFEYARFLRERVPGFEESYLSYFGWTLGVRETRRASGEYIMTREDVLSARSFTDGLAFAAWPIEIHTDTSVEWGWLPDDRWAEVPLRAMLPLGTTNLQAIGRCLSATHDAHGSTRVMGTAMSMGEAAGLIAARASDRGADLRALDIKEIQRDLKEERVSGYTPKGTGSLV